MELPGDFQENFYMILTKFGDNFGRESSAMTEKDEQRMTTPSTMRQVGKHWRKQNNAALARWRGWAQPFGDTRTNDCVILLAFRNSGFMLNNVLSK